MQSLLEQEVIVRLQEIGITYLGGWSNMRTPLNYVCTCGNHAEGYFNNLLRGVRCYACSYNGKFTQEYVEQEFLNLGLVLLDTYRYASTPVRYICTCGGIGKSAWSTIQRGIRCGKCKRNNYIKEFEGLGYKVINYDTCQRITYICPCGNTYTNSVSNWSFVKGCPKCRKHWSEALEPKFKAGRPSLSRWKRLVLERDDYTCQNTSCEDDTDLNIHHIEAYSIRPDLAKEVSNGITLCFNCHTLLHRKYGRNVGLENLTREIELWKTCSET